jgi:hypothetical protein
MSDEPRRRGRPKKHPDGMALTVPAGMPQVPDAAGSEREQLANWWRQRIRDMQVSYDERIEILRTVGEHPSPVFANLVRIDGALGMPKSVVAKKLGISIGSLMAWYGDEYELGAAEIMSQIAANAIRIAVSQDDPNAARVAMQVLDRRGGDEWKPPAQKIVTETGKTDGTALIDSSKMTADERQQMRTMLERIANGGEGEPEEEIGI